MKLVVIESPYGAKNPDGSEDLVTVARNRKYLDRCILDCIQRDESPYASHKMLTDALRDSDPDERKLGIAAGLKWASEAHLIAVYTDYGVSIGMAHALIEHGSNGHEVEFRTIGKNDEDTNGQ